MAEMRKCIQNFGQKISREKITWEREALMGGGY
jgi:hypothetical protein